jgi:hypothetical protein
LQEVKTYFRENEYSEEAASKAHEYYSLRNWIDANGKKVSNWKSKMISVWFKDENRAKAFIKHIPDTPSGPKLQKIS